MVTFTHTSIFFWLTAMNVKSNCCNIHIYDPFNVQIKLLKIQAYKPQYDNLTKNACCNHYNHTAGHGLLACQLVEPSYG